LSPPPPVGSRQVIEFEVACHAGSGKHGKELGDGSVAKGCWPAWAFRPFWWQHFGPNIKAVLEDLEKDGAPYVQVSAAVDCMMERRFSWHGMARALWPYESLVAKLNGLILQDLDCFGDDDD